MNALRIFLAALGLCAGASAQTTAAKEPLSRLSTSAEEELSHSIEQLNSLRAEIATEKLPLAQELTQLEERLSDLRAEHDRVTRLVDEGNLGISSLKTEMNARRDELSYTGNLLDEYARTFESKVSPAELQQYGAAVATAKEATENTALSMAEKFARQLAFASVSVTRLFDSIGGMRFPGVGVDLHGSVVNGQFAIIGPVSLFRSESGEAAGVVVPQSGSDKPLIRPLDGGLQAGIASLVGTGEGLIPLDPSRGGALKALIQKTNVYDIFKKGGPIMWPLLIASILALGTVLERVFFLMNEKVKRDPKALDQLFTAVGRGDVEGAIKVGNTSRYYVVRALTYALAHKETSLASALIYAQAKELKRFQRGISVLDTVITLAPLLGLLGTVTGMMGSFSLIGGELSAPGAITGGIAEALIATAFGLGIAITSLLPFNYLNTRIEEVRHEIDSAATQLELLIGPAAVLVPQAPPEPPAGRPRQEQKVPRQGGKPALAQAGHGDQGED